MSGVIIAGDTSGSVTLQAPAVSGTTVLTLPATTGTVALTSDVIGIGQTWQNVTASRAVGTTYTNATGKPIYVSITPNFTNSQNTTGNITVDGVIASSYVCYVAATTPPQYPMTVIVPNGSTYVFNTTVSTIRYWAELR